MPDSPKEIILTVDSSVSLMHHDPSDLALFCYRKKRKIRFWIQESDL